MTNDEIRCLAHAPFNGLRPGDNLWPDVELVDASGKAVADGAMVNDLIRRGYIVAFERPTGRRETHDEGFEVEYRWRYRLTPKGETALREARNAQ